MEKKKKLGVSNNQTATSRLRRSPSVKEVFRDLVARSFEPEAGGVIRGEEVLHVLRRLHERPERSRPFTRENDRGRQHPIWQRRTASTAKKTPVGGKKKKYAPESQQYYLYSTRSKRARQKKTYQGMYTRNGVSPECVRYFPSFVRLYIPRALDYGGILLLF